jgi:small subunit ribosomal protein S8
MSWSDPIADMLTRIRNGARVGKTQVEVKASKVCQGIAEVLKSEGFIEGYDRIDDGKQGFLRVVLKYDETGQSAITDIQRVSKPGCRRYASVEELPVVLGGMGITVVSTSKGIISDRNCRANKVGGEVLCTVY